MRKRDARTTLAAGVLLLALAGGTVASGYVVTLLAPGSFARERKTKKETVAVCFPLSDGTWAALCLRDRLRSIKL